MGFDIEKLKKAAEEATLKASEKTAAARAKAMGGLSVDDIIKEMRNGGVDEETVRGLEKEINKSTDRNEAIQRIMERGGDVADFIKRLI